jgi:hypothetical protein
MSILVEGVRSAPQEEEQASSEQLEVRRKGFDGSRHGEC